MELGEFVQKDLFYMQEAIQEARKALTSNDIPIGAIVVLDDKIIGRGYNQREANCDPSAHAEIIALRDAGKTIGRWHLAKATLYVTHEPCPMCAGAAIMARIDRIVYGCHEPNTGVCGSLMNLVQFPGFPHNVRITGPIAQDECQALTRSFFKDLRN